jgi:hypothetical protein
VKQKIKPSKIGEAYVIKVPNIRIHTKVKENGA